ncbi:epsin-2 [Onthophagus taurus]|uniref:epsin-2 n=1 Tax=Onthophagus taurus TaxID=166361 RepID=UPI0039BDC9FF
MRRNSEMQVNVAGLRRNLKNLAHNYSDAQRKVREATSNDPWGPSSTIMAEIADLTYNVVAYTEIMQMIWKRLNDHGKNWRHVYKALVLLEYLIKTGTEKVAQQCKENIFAIKTLKDFQYLEEGKDQGQNVREKAKQLANLLQDDEKLKNERARALKAKERFAQTASAFGSDGGLDTPSSPRYPAFRGSEWSNSRDSGGELPRDLEVARPQTAGEEELQLQLALAMSREEAEQEEQKRRSDDVRLQLALSQSQQDFKQQQEHHHKDKHSHMVDLLDVNLSEGASVDPWGIPQPPRQQSSDEDLFEDSNSSPWHPNSSISPPNHHHHHPVPPPIGDPWLPSSSLSPTPGLGADPWSSKTIQNVVPELPPRAHDPWSPTSPVSSTDLDEFDIISNRNQTKRDSSPKTNGNEPKNDPFEVDLLGDAIGSVNVSTGATKKTPHAFLGENSSLVNLDNLVTSKPMNSSQAPNPFSEQPQAAQRQIFNTPAPKPSMNEIKSAPFGPPMVAPISNPAYNPNSLGFGSYGANTNNGQFGAPSPVFGASTQQIQSQQPPIQDPWKPVQATNSNLGAPWMKQGYTFY